MAGRYRPPKSKMVPQKRDISPIGASKFEVSYSAPIERKTSTNTSPSDTDLPSHFHKPSVESSVPTYTTAATSTEEFPPDFDELSGQVCNLHHDNFSDDPEDGHNHPHSQQDREAWFQQQTTSSSSLPIDDGDLCPDRATLAAVYDIPIYDAEGNARPFGTLYDPEHAPNTRQLIIFVRWFYCGACQAYVKALSSQISMQDYFSIPTPTSIIIIGCGKPDLIPIYKKLTNQCHFPIFAEPTRNLFKKLGMKWSLSLGTERPEYMRDISILDVVRGQVKDISGAVRDPGGIKKRDVLRGGHPLQIGGEFLFEGGEVVWCHRMRHMRGHAEVDVLRKLMELDE